MLCGSQLTTAYTFSSSGERSAGSYELGRRSGAPAPDPGKRLRLGGAGAGGCDGSKSWLSRVLAPTASAAMKSWLSRVLAPAASAAMKSWLSRVLMIGCSSCGNSSSRMSSTVSVNFAPCLRRPCVPRLVGASIGPGTANTSRPCSAASLAVINEPLPSAASTTTTPSERPLRMRLRRGKCAARGGDPRGNSVSSAPASATCARSCVWSGG